MHHIAILGKEWDLLGKVIKKEKTIESRWYKTRRPPWDSVQKGDTVYFKESGAPIMVKATVGHVIQYAGLAPWKMREILELYGRQLCIPVEHWKQLHKEGKNYAILIFLEKIQKVEPFDISKKGFGKQTAWITVENIEEIKNQESTT